MNGAIGCVSVFVVLAVGSTLSWVELILHKNTKISLPLAANFFYNLTHDLAVIHGAELTYLFMTGKDRA